MVVGGISEFLHSLVQLLLRTEFIEVGALVLQGIEVPLHWRIVVWIPGFAHALGHMDGSAELYESLRCILAPLVAVQNQAAVCRTLGFQCFLQRADCKSCLSLFSNTLWGLPGFAPGFLGRTMERRPICVFMYLWMVAAL